MSAVPHPLEIRTRLMCALLSAGHDVATAHRMTRAAEHAVLFGVMPEEAVEIQGDPIVDRAGETEVARTTSASGAEAPQGTGGRSETADTSEGGSHETVTPTAEKARTHTPGGAAPVAAPSFYVPAFKRLLALDTTGMTVPEIAAALGVTEPYAFKLCKDLGKTYKRRHRGPDKAPRAKRAPAAERTEPKRRFTDHAPLNPEAVQGLPATHDAVRQARTLFPATVVDPKDSPRLLVSGEHNRKIGDRVVKGPWSGKPIFVLTLEERATCPSYCHVYRECYGNGMPMARRHRHGLDLEIRLERELAELHKEHPQGFVVRLHQLGDFYSVEYVDLWLGWLQKFPRLHAFGYTAWSRDSDIGGAIHAITQPYWDRFAIRFSDATPQPQGATTIWRLPEGPTVPEGIICPAQTDATAACGTCGLCWSAAARDKTIVFVGHGNARPGRPAKHDLKVNAKAAARWPGEYREGPKPETGDPVPDGRARFPQVMRRRCDCGRLFETDVVDQTMCATCTENAARHREAQAGREAR